MQKSRAGCEDYVQTALSGILMDTWRHGFSGDLEPPQGNRRPHGLEDDEDPRTCRDSVDGSCGTASGEYSNPPGATRLKCIRHNHHGRGCNTEKGQHERIGLKRRQ